MTRRTANPAAHALPTHEKGKHDDQHHGGGHPIAVADRKRVLGEGRRHVGEARGARRQGLQTGEVIKVQNRGDRADSEVQKGQEPELPLQVWGLREDIQGGEQGRHAASQEREMGEVEQGRHGVGLGSAPVAFKAVRLGVAMRTANQVPSTPSPVTSPAPESPLQR